MIPFCLVEEISAQPIQDLFYMRMDLRVINDWCNFSLFDAKLSVELSNPFLK